jgi:cytochrome P450
MYLGGADTTVCALMTFFLAIKLFPEVQKRAQAEIDAVVGTARLPSSADRPRLPYLEAVIKEIHRWHPVTSSAIPHCTSAEDLIRGYIIPRAEICYLTFGGLHMILRYIQSPWNFYGRRICPGRFLADSTLFITLNVDRVLVIVA